MSRRTRPYTEAGLKRVGCIKCGAPATAQWQICADGNTYRGICSRCDVELNRMVMQWAFGGRRDEDAERYARKRLNRSQIKEING